MQVVSGCLAAYGVTTLMMHKDARSGQGRDPEEIFRYVAGIVVCLTDRYVPKLPSSSHMHGASVIAKHGAWLHDRPPVMRC